MILRTPFLFITSSFLFFCFLAACSGDSPEENPDVLTEKDPTEVVDSLDYYQKKLKADPNNPKVKFERAKYYVRQGDIEMALIDLEDILAKDSMQLQARLLYADIMLATLDLDTSKYQYEYILKKDSTVSGAYLGLAKIYAALSNYAAADAYISRSLKVDPYSADPYFTRGLIYRSDFYQRHPDDPKKKESWKIAVSSFQTAIEQEPDYYEAYIELGVMHAEQGDSIALEYYNSALDIYPESIEAWYNKGYYYQNRGEVDNALNCFYTLVDIDSSWYKPYYNLGYIHLIMTEELDSAVYYFQECTKWDPTNYAAYNNLGLAWEKKGDKYNAKKYYQKSVDINPDFQLAKDNLNAVMK